jgi:uncharacterized protein YegJ (DUF2314 family)
MNYRRLDVNGISCFLLLLFVVASCSGAQAGNVPAPVVDSEFEAAVTHAHESFGEFIKYFESPNPSQTFSAIKVRLKYEDGFSEEIWFDTLEYRNGLFYGMISEDSIHSRTLRVRKYTLLPEEDMIDWMVVRDGELIGGYTIRLAYARMTAEEKKLFLDSIDYSLE